jgi:hypothetical protein
MVAAPTAIFQIGSPFDGSDLLIWSLRKNEDLLTKKKIAVPRPKFYRNQLADLAEDLQGEPAPKEDQEQFLYTGNPARVLFTDPEMIGPPRAVFAGGGFFQHAALKPTWTRHLFPEAKALFLMGICNPATLIADMVKAGTFGPYGSIVGGADVFNLHWSKVIERIKEANPDVPLVIWTKEESAYVWPDVLRVILGVQRGVPLKGTLDPLEPILKPAAFKRAEAYIEEHPNLPKSTYHKVLDVFIDKSSRKSAATQQIKLPGWTDQTLETVTLAYETDLDRIAAMDGVTLITA